MKAYAHEHACDCISAFSEPATPPLGPRRSRRLVTAQRKSAVTLLIIDPTFVISIQFCRTVVNGVSLYAIDMDSLLPGQELTDAIIDAFVRGLSLPDRVAIASSWLTQVLLVSGDM